MDHIDRWNILEPDQIALRLPGRDLTYRELSTLVSRGSGALAGYGVKAGDLVAVWVKNDLPSLVALWAVPRMGAVVVPLSSRLPHPQAMAQLDLVDPALVLGNDALTGRDTHATDSLFNGRPTVPHPHAPDDLHSVFFTSGSGGEPKGVRLTWGNHEASAAAAATRHLVGPADSWLAVLPLFHLGGFAITYRMFRAGGAVALEPDFEPARLASGLESVTYASFVPTMVRALLAERSGGYAGPSKGLLVGGAPVPVELHQSARSAGLAVCPTYGMTEAASQVATALPSDTPGSGALPLEGVEVEAGSPARPGAVRIAGPMVSPGYWNEPDREGWLETGDIGYLDEEGRLHIVGRSDDVIISGGENIYPAEIEAVLLAHSAVQAAAVFGVPDDLWGRRVEAAVVLSDETASRESVAADVRQSLADFKVPKRWHIVDELPIGPTGKVDRRQLIDLVSTPPV